MPLKDADSYRRELRRRRFENLKLWLFILFFMVLAVILYILVKEQPKVDRRPTQLIKVK